MHVNCLPRIPEKSKAAASDLWKFARASEWMDDPWPPHIPSLKFNSSPLKNDGWKKLLDPFGMLYSVQGLELLRSSGWAQYKCSVDAMRIHDGLQAWKRQTLCNEKSLHHWKRTWNLNFWSISEKEKHRHTNHQLSGSMGQVWGVKSACLRQVLY